MKAAVVALALAGCSCAPMGVVEYAPEVTPFEIPAPGGAAFLPTHRFTPTRAHQRWYRAMERCAAMHGDYRAVRWYVAPGPWAQPGITVYGMHIAGVIVLNQHEIMDSALVSHEALHHILYVNGFRPPRNATIAQSHPAPYGRCAEVSR